MRVPYVDFRAQYQSEKTALLEALDRTLDSGQYIQGEEVTRFESSFAELAGASFAIGVGSGTDALVFALKALGLGEGDEVITPPNSWVSSTSAVVLAGAKPVFADVGEDFTIDPAEVKRAITDRTKAIIAVHLTGRCADLGELRKIAQEREIYLIEDAAQSVLARRGELLSGSGGHVGCFSLHPLKNLNAVGDAGVITTSDQKLSDRLRLLRNHGLVNRDEIESWGYNSRLDSLQACVLNCRLAGLKGRIERRRANAKRYQAGFSGIREITCPSERSDEYHTYHTFVVQAESRDELLSDLLKNEIEAKVHYPIPIHLQRAAAELGYRKGDFPVTEAQASRILTLPVQDFLSSDQIDFVIEKVRSFYT